MCRNTNSRVYKLFCSSTYSLRWIVVNQFWLLYDFKYVSQLKKPCYYFVLIIRRIIISQSFSWKKNTWNLCFLILFRLESRVKPPHIILLYIYEKWTEIWQFMVKITFRSIVCWQLLIFFVFLLLREILIMWVAPCNPFLFGVKIRMYTEILRASSPRNPFEA